jgi:hypothetical protein
MADKQQERLEAAITTTTTTTTTATATATATTKLLGEDDEPPKSRASRSLKKKRKE